VLPAASESRRPCQEAGRADPDFGQWQKTMQEKQDLSYIHEATARLECRELTAEGSDIATDSD